MRSDSQLQRDIIDGLQWEPNIDEANLSVVVKDGVVTLNGFVPCLAQKAGAVQAVKRLSGVKAVADEIEVHVSSEDYRPDSEIAAAIVHALAWDTSVPHDEIKVGVSNGHVQLDGQVEWSFQRQFAEEDVRRMIGVKSVRNLITVKPRCSTGEVKSQIEKAFQRTAAIDAGRIDVQIIGDRAVLSGHVRSWSAR